MRARRCASRRSRSRRATGMGLARSTSRKSVVTAHRGGAGTRRRRLGRGASRHHRRASSRKPAAVPSRPGSPLPRTSRRVSTVTPDAERLFKGADGALPRAGDALLSRRDGARACRVAHDARVASDEAAACSTKRARSSTRLQAAPWLERAERVGAHRADKRMTCPSCAAENEAGQASARSAERHSRCVPFMRRVDLRAARSSAASAGRRARSNSDHGGSASAASAAPGGRAPPRLRPLRRPRRLHGSLRGARRRGHARAPLALLRDGAERRSSATAARSRSSSATP